MTSPNPNYLLKVPVTLEDLGLHLMRWEERQKRLVHEGPSGWLGGGGLERIQIPLIRTLG
jgi:hypothetical protein